MKKNQLVTTKSTSLILGKSKSLMGITKKILEAKSRELATHESITIIGDLMWEKETQEEMDWFEAMEYARNLTLGGYDWRLPTIEEFCQVVTSSGGIVAEYGDYRREHADENEMNEAYKSNYKAKGFHGYYWSSVTKIDSDPDESAWCIGFQSANKNHSPKSCKNYVRCVRGKKPSKISIIKRHDVEAYEALRILRAEVALERGLPTYIIFSEKTLKDMAYRFPQNKKEMLEVISKSKFEKYGDVFLEALRQYKFSNKISINEKL